MLVIFFTEVHPFGSVTAEPISVDIVAPEEVTEGRRNPKSAKEEETSRDAATTICSFEGDGSAKPATAIRRRRRAPAQAAAAACAGRAAAAGPR